MAECSNCIHSYHAAKDNIRSSYPAELITALLKVMGELDERRVLGWLKAVEGVTADMSLPKQLLCGLFEALSQEPLLRLPTVTAAVAGALLQLSHTHELALDEAGRYHGLYRLMGHPDSNVRALVSGLSQIAPCVSRLGSFKTWEEVQAFRVDSLMSEWLQQLQPQPTHIVMDDGPQGRGHDDIIAETPAHLWLGLRTLLQCLEPPVLLQALSSLPALTATVIRTITPAFSPVYRSALATLLLLVRRAGHAALDLLCPDGHPPLHRLVCTLAQGCHAVIDASLHKVCRSGRGYTQLIQDSALSAALRFVTRAVQSDAAPPCVAAHIVGSSVVHAAMMGMVPGGGGFGHQMNDDGARAVCTILQVDASALHALLIGRLGPHTGHLRGGFQRPYSRKHSICPAASPAFDATHSCTRALEDVSSYRCAPAYWRAVAGCSHPAVAAALLSAAAHLSGVDEGDSPEDAAVLQQSKELGARFVFGLPGEVSAARVWVPAASVLHPAGSRSGCPVNHTPADDAQASSSQCLLAARAPRLLLGLLRAAAGRAGAALSHCSTPDSSATQACKLVSPASQRSSSPKPASPCTPSGQPGRTCPSCPAPRHPPAHRPTTATAPPHTSPPHPLERSALTSAFRLMSGTCPRLRRASADALLARGRRDGGGGAGDGGGGGDLGTVLTRTLLPSLHAAVALVRGASMVVRELLQRQRHSSGDQLLSHPHFQHALPPLKLLLQAAGDHMPLLPLLQPLAAGLWKLLTGCLHAATIDPIISAAIFEAKSAAFDVAVESTLSDSDSEDVSLDPKDLGSWLPRLLDFGLQLQPGSAAAEEWLSAVTVMVLSAKELGSLPKSVMQAAARVMDFDSCISVAARMELAALLPEAAPGNTGQAMTGKGLNALPSSALAPAAAPPLSAPAPLDVLNLCTDSDSDSDHDDSWRLAGGPSRSDTAMPSHARLQASPPPSPPPQGSARKLQPVKSRSKSPARPGDFWRSLGGQRGGTTPDAARSGSKGVAAAQGAKTAGPSQATDSQLPLAQWWTKSHKQQPAVTHTSGGVTDTSAGGLAGSGSSRDDQLLWLPPSMRGATASAVAAVARQAAAEAAALRAEEGAGGPASVFDHGTDAYRGGGRGGGGGGGASNDAASESVPLAKRLAMLRSALNQNASGAPSFRRPGFLAATPTDPAAAAANPVNFASGVWALDRLASTLPPGSSRSAAAPASRHQSASSIGGKRLTNAASSLLGEIRESNGTAPPATANGGGSLPGGSTSGWHSIHGRGLPSGNNNTPGGRLKVSLMDALGGSGKVAGAARHTMLVNATNTAQAAAAAARGVRAASVRPVAPPLKMEDIHREVVSWGVAGLLSGTRSSPAAAARTGGSGTAPRTFGGGGGGGGGAAGGRGGGGGGGGGGVGGERLTHVPLRFTSLDHYARIFRPLLMEELRAGVLSAVEESGGAGPPVSVGVTLSELMRTDEHSHSLTFTVAQGPSGEPQGNQRGGGGGGGGGSRTDPRFGDAPAVRSDDLVLLSRGRVHSLGGGRGSSLALPDPCLLLLVTEVAMEMGVRVVKVGPMGPRVRSSLSACAAPWTQAQLLGRRRSSAGAALRAQLLGRRRSSAGAAALRAQQLWLRACRAPKPAQ
ncbi:MAG: hypothetical protein WDW36_002088 [Sanguina aurantia]